MGFPSWVPQSARRYLIDEIRFYRDHNSDTEVALLIRLASDPRMEQAWKELRNVRMSAVAAQATPAPVVVIRGPKGRTLYPTGDTAEPASEPDEERIASLFIEAAWSAAKAYDQFRKHAKEAEDRTKSIGNAAGILANLLDQAHHAGALVPMECSSVLALLRRAPSNVPDWPAVRHNLIGPNQLPAVARAWEKAPKTAQIVRALAVACDSFEQHHGESHIDAALTHKRHEVNEYVRAFVSLLRESGFAVKPQRVALSMMQDRQPQDRQVNALRRAVAAVTNVVFGLDGRRQLGVKEVADIMRG